jgi:chromosome condensin MukBEF MukE localization factor
MYPMVPFQRRIPALQVELSMYFFYLDLLITFFLLISRSFVTSLGIVVTHNPKSLCSSYLAADRTTKQGQVEKPKSSKKEAT